MAKRNPERLDAWILGSGIAPLTAAVHLIQEAHVLPSHIHIIESLSVAGGQTASHGDAENGYDFRAGVRPQYNDMCMDALLSLVPSTSDPSRSVRDEILEFATSLEVQPPRGRFLARKTNGVGRVDAKKMALGLRDRIDLFTLASKSEKTLGRGRICDFFTEGFFRSGYWLSLATSFGLKPSHSAAEFRRYLHRFSNLHDLLHPYPLDLGKYNVHESTIVPIVQFLLSKGVDFRFNTTICGMSFAQDNPNKPNDPTRVTSIQTSPVREPSRSVSSREEKSIQVSADDIVIVSLGSIFSSLLPGTNTHPPPSLHLDPTTITDPETSTELFSRLTETTAQPPGPNTLLTLRDSPWLLTLRIPTQPVFPDQPPHIQVCWGYALAPERSGTHITKPMIDCTGQEILSEILSHLEYPLESILEKAVTIPCIQPRGAATLLPRDPTDRPAVIPEGMRNMAVIGPFVEIADEVAVTTDYSVRGAQIAVRELMGVGTVVAKSKKGSAIGLLGL